MYYQPIKQVVHQYQKGKAFFLQGKQQQAIQCFNKIIELDPYYLDAYISLGNTHVTLKNYLQAIQIYSKAIQKGLNDSTISYNLANAYYDAKMYKESAKWYLKTLQIDPKKFGVYYNLGNAYFDLGWHKLAIKSYTQYNQYTSNDPRSYQNLGIVYNSLQKNEEAIASYLKAIQLDQGKKSVYLNLGNTYISCKKYHKAIEAYLKAIQIDPKYSNALFNLGAAYHYTKDYRKVIQFYVKAIELQPNNFLYLTSLGNIYLQEDNVQMAAKYFFQVKKIISQPNFKNSNFPKQKNISQKNIQFVESSLRLFEDNHEHLLKLKKQFENNTKAIERIKIQQSKIYQPIVTLLYYTIKDTIKQDKYLQNNNNNNKESQQIQTNRYRNTYEQMNRRFQALENQLRKQIKIINEKVLRLQEKMITKQQIDLLYKELSHQNSLNKIRIKKLEDFMRPQQILEAKIQFLKKNSLHKTAKYAQTLYWLLNSYISSYRILNHGIIQKGNQVQKGQAGEVVKKISNILRWGQMIPIIGPACLTINAFLSAYVDESQNIIIQKLASKFSQVWNERMLSNYISQIILLLTDKPFYVKMIENKINQQKKAAEWFATSHNSKNYIIFGQLQNLSDKTEDVMAIADCSIIIKQIIQLKSKDIQAFTKQRRNDNFLIIVAQILLEKRQNESKNNQKTKRIFGLKEQSEQTCNFSQSCDIM